MYDPLLVRYLAEELNGELRGRACAAAPLFAPDLSVHLPVEGRRAVRLDLHPTRGWIRLVADPAESTALDSRCLGVEAPVDERVIVIHLAAPDRFGATPRRLILELHTNQWNAVLASADDDRILSVLRARSAGKRSLRAGAAYEPPAGQARFGAEPVDQHEAWQEWRTRMEGVAADERRPVLLRGFAYTGAPNADAILGEAGADGGPDALRRAFERWLRISTLPLARPVLLRLASGTLPYPIPLPGVPAEPVPSVLEGMSRVAEAEGDEVAMEGTRPDADLLAAAARRVESLERRIARLEEELESAGEADRLRAWGDLLLAKLHELPRGADEVVLEDWNGGTATIPMDPALSPAENAARLYDEARKRDRARDRLPGLIQQAREEAERWRAAADSQPGGSVPDWAAAALAREAGDAKGTRAGEPESRPYRVYRTSGGLEVRVGRSARANDRLTFGHSSPNDVWLHAQSVPGSHVILRWSADDSPPARDLEEAAVLAARYSRARTSTVVAVDWTRRKHVRKPRGAPPGSVVIQRARTVFVAPDPQVEERMRED